MTKLSMLAAATLALQASAPECWAHPRERQHPPIDSASSVMPVWHDKPQARYSSTPNSGFGQRVARARAKAKAASKARAGQRLRSKGKR